MMATRGELVFRAGLKAPRSGPSAQNLKELVHGEECEGENTSWGGGGVAEVQMMTCIFSVPKDEAKTKAALQRLHLVNEFKKPI